MKNSFNKYLFSGLIVILYFVGGFSNAFAATAPVFKTVVDGPHVFYEGEEIVVRNFMISTNLCKMEEERYAADDYISLFVKLDPAGTAGFKLPLRKEHKPSPSTYPQPEKIFAISDIEGEFSTFYATLKGNGIIDERFNWTYGDGHLVLNGDFMDRGEHVTATLWLIYKLEAEAERAGGKVHFILGNHEQMNMSGDERFAASKYKRVADKMEISIRDLYEKDTELGRWLRTKNIVEKIGNTLFVHGGLSPEFAATGFSLSETNEIAQFYMGESLRLIELQSGNKKTPMVFAKNGPMWYRGYFKENMTGDKLQKILNQYDAAHVVVGHTVVEKIEEKFDGKLIPIDVKQNKVLNTGVHNALIIENGKSFYSTNYKGKKSLLAFSDVKKNDSPSVEADIESPTAEQEEKIKPVKEKPKKENLQSTVAVAHTSSPSSNATTSDKPQVPVILQAIEDENILILKGYLYDHDIDAPYESETFTLLHFAIGRGKLKVVKFLMDENADPDIFYQNKTALMYAIQKNEEAISSYLIDLGVNLNRKNANQQTALHYAAKFSTPAIAKLLIDNGARLDYKDAKGRTALEIAELNKNIPVATYLKGLMR